MKTHIFFGFAEKTHIFFRLRRKYPYFFSASTKRRIFFSASPKTNIQKTHTFFFRLKKRILFVCVYSFMHTKSYTASDTHYRYSHTRKMANLLDHQLHRKEWHIFDHQYCIKSNVNFIAEMLSAIAQCHGIVCCLVRFFKSLLQMQPDTGLLFRKPAHRMRSKNWF